MKDTKKCLQCGASAKLTRGLCHKDYSSVMKKIARGEISERTLVKKGSLLPGKGITTGRDNKMFLKGSKKRGRASNPMECLVVHCTNKIRNKRGLCITHHSYAWDLIRNKKASEEDLIKRRLMHAPGKAKGLAMKAAKPRSTKRKKKTKAVSKWKRKPKSKRSRNRRRSSSRPSSSVLHWPKMDLGSEAEESHRW